jgi:hypothetical protein
MKRNRFFALAPVLGLASILLYGVTAAPGHGYVSVPAPAFQPQSHDYQYWISSGWVRNLDGDSDYYRAPVQLPHGATLTKLSFFWKDGSSTADGYCQLWQSGLSGSYALGIASAATDGDAGLADSSEVTITMFSTVDNSQYAYGLTVYLPDSSVEAFGAIVEYVYPVSLPLVLRNFQKQ